MSKKSTSEKLERILLDLEIGRITIALAKNKILKLFQNEKYCNSCDSGQPV
jgi:hypothetical protein